MNKKINVLSSVDFTMLGEEFKELKKKTIFNFSINSKKKTLEKIKYADIYIASAYFRLDKNILDKAENLKIIFSPATGKDHLDLVEIKKKKNQTLPHCKRNKIIKKIYSYIRTSVWINLNFISVLNKKCISSQKWLLD